MENKVVISEDLIKKVIILMVVLAILMLLMLFSILRIQLSNLCFDSLKETMEFNHFVRFRLPYFMFN